MPRIVDLLARHDAKATFFVPAVAALLYRTSRAGSAARVTPTRTVGPA